MTGNPAYAWGWSACLTVGHMNETENMLGVWAQIMVQIRLTVATLAPEVHNRRAA